MKKSFSEFFSRENRLLLAVASSLEMAAVLEALPAHSESETPSLQGESTRSRSAGVEGSYKDWDVLHLDKLSVLQTGVGKANASGAVAKELTSNMSRRGYSGVLAFGIAGGLDPHLEIGSTVYASKVTFADEGTPEIEGPAWTSLETAGWAVSSFLTAESDWADFLKANANRSGVIATVSTISGTDEIARSYQLRTSAIAEDMEGAAVAQVCQHFEIPFAELRIISNRCGNRAVNKLDIPTSFRVLKEIVRAWGFAFHP